MPSTKSSLREFEGSHSQISFKPVLRSSNSVYYPNILKSLYLPPTHEDLDENTVKKIKKIVEKFNITDEHKVAEEFKDLYEITLDPTLIKRVGSVYKGLIMQRRSRHMFLF